MILELTFTVQTEEQNNFFITSIQKNQVFNLNYFSNIELKDSLFRITIIYQYISLVLYVLYFTKQESIIILNVGTR